MIGPEAQCCWARLSTTWCECLFQWQSGIMKGVIIIRRTMWSAMREHEASEASISKPVAVNQGFVLALLFPRIYQPLQACCQQ